mgnify:CR=1 FL=1
MKNFNKRHPELQEDEVFLMNILIEPPLIGKFKGITDFCRIGYSTKRMGNNAYDRTGKLIKENVRPVFVKRSELIEKGIDPDKLNPDVIPYE